MIKIPGVVAAAVGTYIVLAGVAAGATGAPAQPASGPSDPLASTSADVFGPRGVKIAADPSDAGSFGIALDVTPDGSTAIVGAQQHNFNRGGAYVFQRGSTGWTKTADLTIPGLQFGDSYGNAVAISADGTWAFIGEVGWQQLTGRVLVFHHVAGVWQSMGKLVSPDPEPFTHFGDSISIDAAGDEAVIGELGAGGFVGRAYVFGRDPDGTWSMRQELAAQEPPAAGQLDFGTSVSLSSDGSTALVGANVYKAAAGAAYVFRNEGGQWVEVGKLMAGVPQVGADFGTSVSLDADGTTALVGAVYEDDAVGAAYVFTDVHGAWVQAARVSVSDADQFGNAVALNASGTEMVVGAEASQTTGTAYLYSSGTGGWVRTNVLRPSVTDRALFGVAVSMDAIGDEAVVGAAFDDGGQPTQSGFGAVYVFPGLPNGPIAAGPH